MCKLFLNSVLPSIVPRNPYTVRTWGAPDDRQEVDSDQGCPQKRPTYTTGPSGSGLSPSFPHRSLKKVPWLWIPVFRNWLSQYSKTDRVETPTSLCTPLRPTRSLTLCQIGYSLTTVYPIPVSSLSTPVTRQGGGRTGVEHGETVFSFREWQFT